MSDGALVIGSEKVKEIWKKHFESMMNGSMRGRAKVTEI